MMRPFLWGKEIKSSDSWKMTIERNRKNVHIKKASDLIVIRL